MKKIVIAAALLIGALSVAQAVEVGVSVAHDYALHANGAKVTLGNYEVAGVKTGLEVVSVRKDGIGYEQYAVTAEKQVAKVGPVAVAGTAKVGFVDRTGTAARDGYVATLGVQAVYPLAKNTSVVAGFERRFGQERTSDLNGNMLTVGLKQSF